MGDTDRSVFVDCLSCGRLGPYSCCSACIVAMARSAVLSFDSEGVAQDVPLRADVFGGLTLGPMGPVPVDGARSVGVADLTARLRVFLAEGVDAERMAKRLVAEFRGCVIAG